MSRVSVCSSGGIVAACRRHDVFLRRESNVRYPIRAYLESFAKFQDSACKDHSVIQSLLPTPLNMRTFSRTYARELTAKVIVCGRSNHLRGGHLPNQLHMMSLFATLLREGSYLSGIVCGQGTCGSFHT